MQSSHCSPAAHTGTTARPYISATASSAFTNRERRASGDHQHHGLTAADGPAPSLFPVRRARPQTLVILPAAEAPCGQIGHQAHDEGAVLRRIGDEDGGRACHGAGHFLREIIVALARAIPPGRESGTSSASWRRMAPVWRAARCSTARSASPSPSASSSNDPVSLRGHPPAPAPGRPGTAR